MTDREKQRLMGFIDANDHFDIFKMKAIVKETLKEALKATKFLHHNEKIEYLELQLIVIKEIILEMEEEYK